MSAITSRMRASGPSPHHSGLDIKIDAYVQFGGRAAEAVAFYQEHLGATVMRAMPFRGTPGCDMVPEAWQDNIMHVAMAIGDSVLMG